MLHHSNGGQCLLLRLMGIAPLSPQIVWASCMDSQAQGPMSFFPLRYSMCGLLIWSAMASFKSSIWMLSVSI